MIKDPLSATIECLENESIHHSLFIKPDHNELHLWDYEKLLTTLLILESRGVLPDTIINKTDFYIIKF